MGKFSFEMRQVFSFLLVLVFAVGLTIPFIPTDGCDHVCCEKAEMCCAKKVPVQACGMTDGEDNRALVLLVFTPKPPKTRLARLIVFERIGICDVAEETSPLLRAEYFPGEFRESATTPLYYLFRTLLI